MTQREQIAQLHMKECNYPIYEGVNTIGRNPQARVNIKNMSISQNHALIMIIKNTHYICDLNSSNGSYMNNIKLQPFVVHEIYHQNEVCFGAVKGHYMSRGPFTNDNMAPFFDASQSYFAATQIMDEEPQRKRKLPQVTVDELKPPSPLPLEIHDDFLPMESEVSQPQRHEEPTQALDDDATDDEVDELMKHVAEPQEDDDETNSEEMFRCATPDSDSDDVIPIPTKRSNVMIISSQEDNNSADVILPAPAIFAAAVTPQNQSMNDSDFVPATQDITRSSKLRSNESQQDKKSSSEESFKLGLTEMMDDEAPIQHDEEVDIFKAPLPLADTSKHSESLFRQSELSDDEDFIGPTQGWESGRKPCRPVTAEDDDFVGATQKIDHSETPIKETNQTSSKNSFRLTELTDDDDFMGPTQSVMTPKSSEKSMRPSEMTEDDDFMGPTQRIEHLVVPKSSKKSFRLAEDDDFMGFTQKTESVMSPKSSEKSMRPSEMTEDDDFMGPTQRIEHLVVPKSSKKSFRLAEDDDFMGFTQKTESVMSPKSLDKSIRPPEMTENDDFMGPTQKTNSLMTPISSDKMRPPEMAEDEHFVVHKSSKKSFRLAEDDDFMGPTQKITPKSSDKSMRTPDSAEDDDFMGPTQRIDHSKPSKKSFRLADDDDFLGPTQKTESLMTPKSSDKSIRPSETVEDDDFMGPTQRIDHLVSSKPYKKSFGPTEDEDFIGPTQKTETPKSSEKSMRPPKTVEDDDFMDPTQRIDHLVVPKPSKESFGLAEDEDLMGPIPKSTEKAVDEDSMGPTGPIMTPKSMLAKDIDVMGPTLSDPKSPTRQETIDVEFVVPKIHVDDKPTNESLETEPHPINEAPTQALDEETVEPSKDNPFIIPETDKNPRKFQFKRKINANLQPPSPKQELQVKLEKSISPKSDTLNRSLALLQSKLGKTRKTTSSSEIYLTVPKGRKDMTLKSEHKIKEEPITPQKNVTKERKSVRTRRKSAVKEVEVSSESDVPESRGSRKKKRLSKEESTSKTNDTDLKPSRRKRGQESSSQDEEKNTDPKPTRAKRGLESTQDEGTDTEPKSSRTKRGKESSQDEGNDTEPKPSRTKRGKESSQDKGMDTEQKPPRTKRGQKSSQDEEKDSDPELTRTKRAQESSQDSEETDPKPTRTRRQTKQDPEPTKSKRRQSPPRKRTVLTEEDTGSDETSNKNKEAAIIVKQEPETPVKRRRGKALESPDSKRFKLSSDESNMSSPNRERRKQRPKVVFTMFNSPQMETMVKRLGGSMVDSVEQCTVLVTEKVKRTQKLLMAIGMGKPICPPQWIVDSKKKGEFLEPTDYILQDPEAEDNWKFSLKESIQRGKGNLLENKSFLIQITNGADVLKGAIEACGGKCLSKAPTGDGDGCFVISSQDNKAKYARIVKKSPAVKVLEAEAIFDGVLRQEMRFDRHYL